jgi:Domain of unknown function (DUF6597)
VVALAVRPSVAALAPFVRSLGYFAGELPPARERVLPSGDMSLVVNLYEDELRTYEGHHAEIVRRTSGAALLGPRRTHQVIDTEEQRCVIEVNFDFGGASHFFPIPSSAARDELVELDDLWGATVSCSESDCSRRGHRPSSSGSWRRFCSSTSSGLLLPTWR